ncbi:MAG TPA: hypothetical protein VL400_19325, partial [Polyangiaceae bacterium]|nr:hypothetical protein [Polyangiaceae bacterium]
ALALLGSFVARPDARGIFFLLLFFKLGDALAAGMVTRWFVKQGLSTTDVALSRGLVGGLAAVAGSFGAGVVMTSLGRRTGLAACAALQSLAIAMYLVLAVAAPTATASPWFPLPVYHAASIVEHLAGGAATAAIFGRMMDLAREDARATDYTAMSCALVAVQGMGLVASGFITKGLGLTGLFAVATVAGLAAPFAAARFKNGAT